MRDAQKTNFSWNLKAEKDTLNSALNWKLHRDGIACGWNAVGIDASWCWCNCYLWFRFDRVVGLVVDIFNVEVVALTHIDDIDNFVLFLVS